MRRRFGTTRRTKKIRSPITVKAKTAKRGGRCAACRGRYEVGDQVTYVKVRRRAYHTASCVPINAGQMPTATGPNASVIGPTAVVDALSTRWPVGDARLVGLAALENAMIVTAKTFTEAQYAEFDKSYRRYQAYKQHVLRPANANEETQAYKLAMVELVKVVFGAK